MTHTQQILQNKTFIQPRKLANKHGELQYQWPIKDFDRLAGLLYSNEGIIKVKLTGKYDDRQRCLVEAHITANIQLECQTTFEAIDYQIDNTVLYCTVISEEQITELDDEYEALFIEDGQVDIKEVIEDELILSIPVVANKASEELGIKMSYGNIPEQTEEEKNPFLVLQNLKLEND